MDQIDDAYLRCDLPTLQLAVSSFLAEIAKHEAAAAENLCLGPAAPDYVRCCAGCEFCNRHPPFEGGPCDLPPKHTVLFLTPSGKNWTWEGQQRWYDCPPPDGYRVERDVADIAPAT
jgi:hypothetical protein